jgi:Na+:H+ antiporter, NhaA family
MPVPSLFKEFFNSEKLGGIILVFATVISLYLTNSAWSAQYLQFWNTQLAGHSITHWVNDGAMTLFFLLIGLELERELYIGELSNLRAAAMPVLGAVGGMLVPATIFFVLNQGTIYQSGTAIPMATDIAFTIGILSLLGNRVPATLKIFLTALAVIDDLGAIIVIAFFYTNNIDFFSLTISLTLFAVMFSLGKFFKVYVLLPYLVGGVLMWYFMLKSGVHATIAGVLLAFCIPFGERKGKSTSYILQHALNKPVAYIILPLFALANTCIVLAPNWVDGLLTTKGIGIILGLFVGKPLGILLFCYLGYQLKVCRLPRFIKWRHLLGAGILAGIGFTMSIFISNLAFKDIALVNSSKMAILVASLVSAIVGLFFLWATLPKHKVD